jgi:hypothetical protein
MTMTNAPTTHLDRSMRNADYVLVDDVVCATSYVRVPDEHTVADDIVLEVTDGDTELDFIRADFDGAQSLGDDAWRLADGRLLRFLTSATLH